MVTSRSYAGPDDLQAMLDLIKARPLDRIADFPGSLDLQEMLAVPKTQAHTRLWIDHHGQLACFAILDGDQNSASVTFEIAPGSKEKSLAKQVIAWAEASARQACQAQNGVFLLETSASSDNVKRIGLLEMFGFERQAGGTVHMERSLADPMEKPCLPAGFSIRPIRGESEAADWVSLHRAALGTENMTVEYKLAMMRTPHYDPAMDLVALAPGGALAAYCVCFIDVAQNALIGHRNGHTDPIATHPVFQRRGLSRALLLSGLTLLKERGMDAACLGTSSQNIAMLHTAGSVGFRITKNIFWYNKSIQYQRQEGTV
jgi:mycothiol synthase